MQRVWSTYLDSSGVLRRSDSPHLSQSQMDNNPPSRRTSIASRANSAYSQATSTRHMLQDHNNILDPPNAPFAASGAKHWGSTTSSPIGADKGSDYSNVSLAINYLPSKFSHTLMVRRRKGEKGFDSMMPKRGGGVEAFRSGESRMPGQHDEDDDNTTSGWFNGTNPASGRKLRWTRFKWILLASNILVTMYSIVALVICLCTWFNVWTHADVIRVGNRSELILSTIASSIGIFTSLVGWAGILLNNRSFLAVYTTLLWITFAFLVTPGYMTYRRQAFNLEGKINAQWSRDLGTSGRLRIQNQLGCCGYFSPFVEATVSQTCYSRSILPGCKLKYLTFERMVLRRWFQAAFLLVPFHILAMLAALMCSNHVTYRFGKGMMPKAYRLNQNDMAIIMENYANQLAEQYGSDVASEVLARSRSNLHLDKSGSSPYPTHTKYDSIGTRAAPEGIS